MSIAAEAAGSGELVLSQSSLARLREALSARKAETGPDGALQEEGAPVASPSGMVVASAGCFVLRSLRPRPPSTRPPQALSTVSSLAIIVHRAADALSTGLNGPCSRSSPCSSPDSRRPADCAGCAASAGGTVQLRQLSTVRSLPQLPSTVHRQLSLCSMRRNSIASAERQHAQSVLDPHGSWPKRPRSQPCTATHRPEAKAACISGLPSGPERRALSAAWMPPRGYGGVPVPKAPISA